MKRVVVASVATLTLAFFSAAQQTVNPALNSHPNDNATFGNQKSPKKEKAPTSRTVTGQVIDEDGQALEGALVTLTNNKTNTKTGFFTKKDGHYQFADLSFTNDYQVQAKYKDKASEVRKLSQYDTAPRPVRFLEIKTGTGTAPDSASAKH